MSVSDILSFLAIMCLAAYFYWRGYNDGRKS